MYQIYFLTIIYILLNINLHYLLLLVGWENKVAVDQYIFLHPDRLMFTESGILHSKMYLENISLGLQF